MCKAWSLPCEPNSPTIAYFPSGGTRSTSGGLNTDKKFTGQRLDQLDLYFYNARYYDPGIGRFISADTIVPDPANPEIEEFLWGDSFWADGYFAESVGAVMKRPFVGISRVYRRDPEFMPGEWVHCGVIKYFTKRLMLLHCRERVSILCVVLCFVARCKSDSSGRRQ